MGYAERHTVSVTTASGTATGFTPNITGRIVSIQYVKPASDSFTDGVDFAVTGEATGLVIWNGTDVNESATAYPFAAGVKSADGAASTISESPVVLVNERVKIVVTSGGDAKNGTFHVVVE
jgi:hypothetical protein